MTAALPAEATVIAVVVAHNRRDLLRESLRALGAQTVPPNVVVVVDNASTDGSEAMVADEFPRVDLLALPRNTGGAGGFAAGIAHVLTEHNPAWLWLMDDDTIPTPTALEALLAAIEHFAVPVALAGSRVLWTDGRDHPMNTPRRSPFAGRALRQRARQAGAVPVRSSSFVSMLVSAPAARQHGLPIADYFIWNDDFEYSTRLLRGNVGLFVPGSVVVHKTARLGSTDVDPGERFFYEVRNKLWLLLRSRSLRSPEKALYGGATLARWGRTLLKSRHRSLLLRQLGKGISAGVLTRPRSNREVLSGLGALTDAVASADGSDTGTGSGSASPAPRSHPTGSTFTAPPSEPPVTAPLSTTPFSLLLPFYAADRPDHLRQAFTSSVQQQLLSPAEVVLVQDGPVGPPLAAAARELVETSAISARLMVLSDNHGLASALEAGLAACQYDVVARMDADDVSLPSRFARQLALIDAGADLVGTGMLEFADTPDHITGPRIPPTGAAIVRYARFADPFNHPTVVYRKAAVQRAGGYQDLGLMEDYWLFARMLHAGVRADNLADPLLLYRTGTGAYARRGGLRQLNAEIRLQREFRRIGFTTRLQAARNLLVRGGYRLVPEPLRRFAYRRLIATGLRRKRGS